MSATPSASSAARAASSRLPHGVINMGVMAAPNRSVIKARVERVERVDDHGRRFLAVKVISAQSLEGGLFVRAGDTARVIAAADDPQLGAAHVFSAEVEYVGGPQGGNLQLLCLHSSTSVRDDDEQASRAEE